MTRFRVLAALSCLLLFPACTEAQYAAHLAKQVGKSSKSQGTFKVGNSYSIAGKRYSPQETYNFSETGIASWYGPGFHGKQTANGEVFNKHELTAAHKTLQMPSIIRVTNLDNGRSLVLRVNDRGPFSRGRVLDVSERGAELLGFKMNGTAKVRIDVLAEESHRVAQAAKAGHDTRGFEVAMNQNRIPTTGTQTAHAQPASYTPPVEQPPAQPQYRSAAVQPVESERLAPAQGHTDPDGRFMPDPVVKQVPVTNSNIYVQAGAFSVEQNALALSQKLSAYGPSKVYLARVNNRPLYRVRLGPFTQVQEADSALASLVSSGNGDAIIIVD